MEEAVIKTRQFVEQEFKAHPHHSFDDWRIMYEHSLEVEKLANRLAEKITCDRLIVSLGALLHDIGKTYEAPEDVLHAKHEKFNWSVSKNFIKTLNLPAEKTKLLKRVLPETSSDIETVIIKDADILAFLSDPRLADAFLSWAKQRNLQVSIERKLQKYSWLKLDLSKKIGKEPYIVMKKRWEEKS